MEEKRYLKWYNKVGYGSGDVAGNVVYAFLSTFVMLYLTNTVGLNPGIVGTLIAVSKLFDGVTDIFFGSMIDKTKTKMGKAKPWMLYGYIGCAVTLIGVFAIPEMGRFYRHVLIEGGFPHHGAVAFGHHGKALFEVFKYIGVPVEEIGYNQPAGVRYPTENPWR